MAISSPGIGSGLDVRTIVSQMVALEQKPLSQLQTKAATFQAKLSAFGQLKSQIANLQDQIAKLASAGSWTAMTFKSGNASAVSGSASSSAQATSFSVEVSQLARTQSTASSAIASGTPMGGRLTIDLGIWNTGPVFADDPNTASVQIDIVDGDTLSQIATKINGANAGVKATVVTDSTGERLLLQSKNTGANAGYRIQASNLSAGSQLGKLVYDPQNTPTGGMDLTQSAQDTKATINGLSLTSANNTFNNVIEGVSLTVAQVTTGPVDVTVAPDTAGMRSMLSNFVSSYNSLSSALKEMTNYDPAKKTAGTLQGDGTATGLQNALRRLITTPGPAGGSFDSLSSLGLEFQKDGTLKISSKLDTALKDPQAMQNLFATETTGLGHVFKSFTEGLLDSDGPITTRNKSLQSSIDRNSKEQGKISERISRIETQLLAQYSRLDAQLGQLNALNSYVSQQVAVWNKK